MPRISGCEVTTCEANHICVDPVQVPPTGTVSLPERSNHRLVHQTSSTGAPDKPRCYIRQTDTGTAWGSCCLKWEGTMEEKGEGWLIFAAVVLGVAGIMRIFDAIWAFRYHGVLPQNFEDAIFGHSLKTYGWVYLIVAIVLILCAFGVVARSQFSRWIGIFAGAILAISAIWWMPFYPVWSLTYIFVGVLVIYGLAAHGGREVTTQSQIS